jgi:hypothetical protein
LPVESIADTWLCPTATAVPLGAGLTVAFAALRGATEPVNVSAEAIKNCVVLERVSIEAHFIYM